MIKPREITSEEIFKFFLSSGLIDSILLVSGQILSMKKNKMESCNKMESSFDVIMTSIIMKS